MVAQLTRYDMMPQLTYHGNVEDAVVEGDRAQATGTLGQQWEAHGRVHSLQMALPQLQARQACQLTEVTRMQPAVVHIQYLDTTSTPDVSSRRDDKHAS
jgi:hypothetical protein